MQDIKFIPFVACGDCAQMLPLMAPLRRLAYLEQRAQLNRCKGCEAGEPHSKQNQALTLGWALLCYIKEFTT